MKERLTVALDAVRLAGQGVRNGDPTKGIVEKEEVGNIVTAADLESEKTIMKLIQMNFPKDSILSEETKPNIENPLAVRGLWVIDPIDGTSNFRFGRNYSAISVAYVTAGEPQIGAVYNPYVNELFHAIKGGGAYLNNLPIGVGNEFDLAKANITTDNSYDPLERKHIFEMILKIDPTPWILMRGSAVLAMCEVAAGRTDLYFANALKPWDNAAALLISKEAGAICRNLDGENINFLSPGVVVGNEPLVTQFIKAIN